MSSALQSATRSMMMTAFRTAFSNTTRHAKSTGDSMRLATIRTRRWAVAGGLLLATAACGDGTTTPNTGVRAPVTISATLTPAQQAVIAGMSAEVTGPGITTPIIATLDVAGSTVNGTVQVPIGDSRTFTIRAFDAQGVETHSGSATAAVVAGTNPPLTVRMAPLAGTVPINVTVGTYGVTLTPATATVAVDGQVTLTANATTNGGTAPGPMTWGVLNPALLTLTVAPDGRSAVVRGRLAGTTRVVASYQGVAAASEVTVTGAVVNQAPVASANGPYTGMAGGAISFSSNGSTDSDGSIVSWLWSFGDGSTSTLANPAKTYTAAGTYTVTLTVTDDDGATATSSTTATVTAPSNQAPSLTMPALFTPTAGTPFTFTATASDADGSVVAYYWYFSDGSNASTTTGSTTKTFASPGTYNVALQVVDNAGAASVWRYAEVRVSVSTNQPPNVQITQSSYSGTVGQAIQFSAIAGDPDGSIMGFVWNFGDGPQSISGLQNPTHTYNAAGSYTVTLTVTDNQGATTTRTVPATISAPPANRAPTLGMQSQFFGSVGSPVIINVGCTDPDGDAISSYFFSFSTGDTRTSTTGSIQYTFFSPGNYQVAANCWDSKGAPSPSKTAIITIQ